MHGGCTGTSPSNSCTSTRCAPATRRLASSFSSVLCSACKATCRESSIATESALSNVTAIRTSISVTPACRLRASEAVKEPWPQINTDEHGSRTRVLSVFIGVHPWPETASWPQHSAAQALDLKGPALAGGHPPYLQPHVVKRAGARGGRRRGGRPPPSPPPHGVRREGPGGGRGRP